MFSSFVFHFSDLILFSNVFHWAFVWCCVVRCFFKWRCDLSTAQDMDFNDYSSFFSFCLAFYHRHQTRRLKIFDQSYLYYNFLKLNVDCLRMLSMSYVCVLGCRQFSCNNGKDFSPKLICKLNEQENDVHFGRFFVWFVTSANRETSKMDMGHYEDNLA